MKRSRFSEEQIIGILKEHEAGVPVADLCGKHGVSDASICKWKAKFGGMEVLEAKRLKTPQDENKRLLFSSRKHKMTGMADRDLLMYPEHRRHRAEEAIAMARDVREAQARERLLKVARSY